MRIGSEAPKRRTHSSNRHESQGACRESATSNRHRYPITRAETVRVPQRHPIIVPDAKRRRPVQRPAARTATGRSAACVPRPRSWACEHRERSPCEFDTTALRRSPSGTLEIATPIGSCLAELDHCRNGLTLDRDHLAVITLTAQPAEKSAFEQFGVETIGLRSPMLARHRHTRGVNDVGLNAARLEPTCQPEAITAGLEGNDNAFDPTSCFLRLLSPSMEQPQ